MTSPRGLFVVRSGGATIVRHQPAERDGEPADGPPVMVVEFSRFSEWYQVDSIWEGQFLERIMPGSFKRTIAQRGGQIKVLFNHGQDVTVGDKVLGVPSVIEERDSSPYMEVPLLDTSYNRDLIPGLRAGAYGSSFMFQLAADEWDHHPQRSEHNPEGLPERSIFEVKLHEAGPVTWPANPGATAGLRSGTDWYVDQLGRRDQSRQQDLLRSLAGFRAEHGLRTPDEGHATPDPTPPTTPAPADAARHVDGISAAARARRLRLIEMAGAK